MSGVAMQGIAMQGMAEADRVRALLRTYVGRDDEAGDGREEHLRRLLAATERMAWSTHGQPEGAPWRRLLGALHEELRAP